MIGQIELHVLSSTFYPSLLYVRLDFRFVEQPQSTSELESDLRDTVS